MTHILLEIFKWFFIVTGAVTTAIVVFSVMAHGALSEQDILYRGTPKPEVWK